MTLPTVAAERKATPITTGVLDYFPDAIAEVARVSKAGNDQHNPGQPLHWDRTKSTDHADCIARHLLERGTIDTDGQRHSAKVAWRALALLQTELDNAAEEEFYQDLESYEPAAKVEPRIFEVPSNIPGAFVIAFPSDNVPLTAILDLIVNHEDPATPQKFRDTAADLAKQMRDIIEEHQKNFLQRGPVSTGNFAGGLKELYHTAEWPDEPGVWAWGVKDELAAYRYRTTDRKDSNDRFIIEVTVGHDEKSKGTYLVAPGSVSIGDWDEEVFGGNLGDVLWVKLEDIAQEHPVQVAEAVTHVEDDGVLYDVNPDETPTDVTFPVENGVRSDELIDWPNSPGVWGYVSSKTKPGWREVTGERYEVTDRATHGGEFLVRRFQSGEFLRRPGSSHTLTIAEFGPDVRGWKKLTEV